MYIGVAPTKATAEGESVRMKMKKKKRTQRGRVSGGSGIEIFEKGPETRAAAARVHIPVCILLLL